MPILPIIGLAIQYLPSLIGFFAGEKAGEVAETISGVAKRVFGTDDATSVQQQIADNPSLADKFVEQLRAETERYKIAVEDTQDARRSTLSLVQAGSPMAWGAVVVSILVTLAFIANIGVLFTVKVQFTETTGQVLLLLTGTLSAAFTQVINYWLGSSAGSTDKSATIAALVAPKPPVKKK